MKPILIALLLVSMGFVEAQAQGPVVVHRIATSGGGACATGVDIGNGWCQIAHTVQGSANTTSVTTTGVDTSGADLIVLVISSYCLGTTLVSTDVSDSKSNSWTNIGAVCDTSGNQALLLVYSKPTSVGSSHTFMVSNATATFPSMEVYAVSGSHASPLDQAASATSGGSTVTTLATSSITPTQNNELIIAGLVMAGSPNTGTPTINASMTIADSTNGSSGFYVGGGLAYITQSTAAGINPSWSWVVAAPAYAAILSFKHS